MKKILIALFLTSLATVSFANKNYYAGLNLGYANTHYGEGSLGANPETTGVGFRLFGGYELTQNFSFELGYTHLPSAKGDSVRELRQQAYDLSAVGRYPLGSGGLSLYAKLGLAYEQAKKDFSTTGQSYANKIRPAYGMGVADVFSPNISFNVQWWRIQGKGEAFNGINVDSKLPSVDMFTVGVAYRFV